MSARNVTEASTIKFAVKAHVLTRYTLTHNFVCWLYVFMFLYKALLVKLGEEGEGGVSDVIQVGYTYLLTMAPRSHYLKTGSCHGDCPVGNPTL